MNLKQKRARYRTLVREQNKQEAKWQPEIKKALDRAVRPVYKSLRDFGVAVTLQNIQTLILPGPTADVLERLYVSCGTFAANSEYGFITTFYADELREGKAFGFNRLFGDLMRRFFMLWGGEKIQSITETERDRIQKVLEESVEQSLSPAETARLLRSSEINTVRSKVIARTEVAAAMNYGQDIGSKRTGVLMEKTWIATHDNRTRRLPRDKFSHLSMDNVKVDQEEMFAVPMKNGGAEMMPYPCWSGGSPGNLINCRCRKIDSAKRDVNGRLIRVPIPSIYV